MSRSVLVLCAITLFMPIASSAQTIDVTFRYTPPPGFSFVRAFAPGEFNNWGNNSNGFISPTDGSLMSFDPVIEEYLYTIALAANSDYQYKVHFHLNESGTEYVWASDPTNPRVDPANNFNSIVTVSDPMLFQLSRQRDASGRIVSVSAGVFGTKPISYIEYEINGVAQEGLANFDSTKGIFKVDLSSPVAPGSKFKIVARDSSGAEVADSVGQIPPAVVDEVRPAGIRDGINYLADPGKATLSLFAPQKSYVYVVGDFNDWQSDPSFLMKRDSLNADSVWFWLELEGLTPGVEYGFQYLVDGQIRVADPYSQKVLDPFHDSFLTSVYPNLKPYPVGKTEHPVSVLQTNKPEYQWMSQDYQRPDPKDLVIYELLIRDFIEAHDYSTLTDTLDYLENLGVNAIELMPVSEFGGNISWGYNPTFHLALDKYYGPAETFKAFVDSSHARGIAVILDVVYNHADGASPLVRMYNTSETGEPGPPPSPTSPYANTVAKHPFNVFNDLNHESTATQYWLDRANEYWLNEFRIDGFRFDLSKGFTQKDTGGDVGQWSAYDGSRIANLQRMADRLWSVDSTAYIILEHFGSETEERQLAEYRTSEGFPGMLMWTKATDQYNEATMGYNSGSQSDFSGGFYKNRGWTLPNLITFMESHDEQWLMYKNIAFGACTNFPGGGAGCDTNPGDYNVRDFPTAFDRMKMAGSFFFLQPGPKMIWQFGELGYGYGSNGTECLEGTGFACPAGTPSRTDPKPIKWEYREDPLREKLYKTWSALLRLRRSYETFSSTQSDVSFATAGPTKRMTLTHPTSISAVVVGNFGIFEDTISPEFPSTGMWYDFFTGDSVDVVNPSDLLTLPPGGFHVFTSVPVEKPEDGLITVGIDGIVDRVDDRLGPAYPNPARGQVQIPVEVQRPSDVRLEVFDLLGRSIRLLNDSQLSSGEHVFSFDTSSLASGLYVYRLTANDRTFSRKLVIAN